MGSIHAFPAAGLIEGLSSDVLPPAPTSTAPFAAISPPQRSKPATASRCLDARARGRHGGCRAALPKLGPRLRRCAKSRSGPRHTRRRSCNAADRAPAAGRPKRRGDRRSHRRQGRRLNTRPVVSAPAIGVNRGDGLSVREVGTAQPQTLELCRWSPPMWRQWRLQWEPTPGSHTLVIRTIGRRATQQAEPQPPYPTGASGYHSVRVSAAGQPRRPANRFRARTAPAWDDLAARARLAAMAPVAGRRQGFPPSPRFPAPLEARHRAPVGTAVSPAADRSHQGISTSLSLSVSLVGRLGREHRVERGDDAFE